MCSTLVSVPISCLCCSMSPPCNSCSFTHSAICVKNGALGALVQIQGLLCRCVVRKIRFLASILSPQTKHSFSKFKAMVTRQVILLALALKNTGSDEMTCSKFRYSNRQCVPMNLAGFFTETKKLLWWKITQLFLIRNFSTFHWTFLNTHG